jgi:hypothetical protein
MQILNINYCAELSLCGSFLGSCLAAFVFLVDLCLKYISKTVERRLDASEDLSDKDFL